MEQPGKVTEILLEKGLVEPHLASHRHHLGFAGGIAEDQPGGISIGEVHQRENDEGDAKQHRNSCQNTFENVSSHTSSPQAINRLYLVNLIRLRSGTTFG